MPFKGIKFIGNVFCSKSCGYVAVLVLAGILCWAPVQAAPPLNDDIADAQVITDRDILKIDLSEATVAPDEPACGSKIFQSVWFTYTPPRNQFIVARASESSTGQRPRVAVWTESSQGLEVVECHPEANQADFPAIAGETYYLQVYSPVPEGIDTIEVRFYEKGDFREFGRIPPENDHFWYAESIDSLPHEMTIDIGASGEGYDDPPICGEPGAYHYSLGDSVWYSYTAQTGGEVDALFTEAQSFYGPYVGVFTGTLDNPRFIACSLRGESREGATRFMTEPGTTYYIVYGSGADYIGEVPIYASMALRRAPKPIGGTIKVEPGVRLVRRYVEGKMGGIVLVSHLYASLSASCDETVKDATVEATITQGEDIAGAISSFDCRNGVGRMTLDFFLSTKKAFTSGPATITLEGLNFDANYNVSSSNEVVIRYSLF